MGAIESWQPMELPSPPRRWGRRARPVTPLSGERVIAIGDVHGRWDLLHVMIQAIDRKLTPLPRVRTRIVVLGDFIDRGPSSKLVIEYLRIIQDRYPSVIILQGNHEAALLDAARGDPDAQRLWVNHGGLETLASYGIEPRRPGEDPWSFGTRITNGIGLEVLDWLEQLPLSYRVGPYFFCHAGIRPGKPIERQYGEDLLWIREAFTEDNRDHGAVIVHGHSIAEDVEVRHNRIGIDTGAYRTGVLSAVVLSEDQNWTLSVSLDGE